MKITEVNDYLESVRRQAERICAMWAESDKEREALRKKRVSKPPLTGYDCWLEQQCAKYDRRVKDTEAFMKCLHNRSSLLWDENLAPYPSVIKGTYQAPRVVNGVWRTDAEEERLASLRRAFGGDRPVLKGFIPLSRDPLDWLR